MAQRKFNLVIDSCCDLPYGWLSKQDVGILNFPFEMSDGTHTDDFWQSMSQKEFFGLMASGTEEPSTAQIPVQVLKDKLVEAAKAELPTVFLCFSSMLSGTFETLERTAADVCTKYKRDDIHVVDSALASVGEGFLVMEAIKQLDNGLSAEEMVEWLNEAKYFVHGCFTVDDLAHLRRGGRIPGAIATAAALLDIKPMLGFEVDGSLASTGMVKGRKKSIKTLAKMATEMGVEQGSYAMIAAHADAEDDMRKMESLYAGAPVEFFECKIGPVIGSHVGPGMIAVVFWGPDRRGGGGKAPIPAIPDGWSLEY